MKLPRLVRLLPAVVLLGSAVLVTKGNLLIHAAYAEGNEKVATLTNDPVPANADYAGGEDDQITSASEVNVMNALAKRRKELDAREAVLNTQANMIAAAESRVDAKINQLKALQGQMTGLLTQRDEAQKAQVASLIKTYGPDGMKPASAAAIFNALPDEVLVPVAQGLKPGDLGAILSKMNPEAAQKLTVKLANKLALPQTAEAPAPVQTAAATPAAPGAQPAATPATSAPAKAPAPKS
jgi:flagellar motility protein MotE (MotC chaperone)